MTPDSLSRSGSAPGSPNRRTLLFVAVAGLAVLIAVGVLMGRGSGEEQHPDEAAHAGGAAGTKHAHAGGGGAAPSGGAGAAPAGEEKGPRFDATICWQDLDRFNEAVTIENFREWAAPLLDSRDALRPRLPEGAPHGAHWQ